jgi:hypothetical protein
MARRAVAALLLVLCLAAPAAALDVRVKDLGAGAAVVATTIELRDILPDRFKKTLDEGGVLHLRLQAELWESRPVWDRLVYPAIVRVFRFKRASANGDVSITDAAGTATSYSAVPSPMPMRLELGDGARITPAERYYVHIIATLGTLADREAEEVGDAVFGRPSETNSLGSLGRLVFRTVLQVSDYLQSISAETRSRKTAGADILKRSAP